MFITWHKNKLFWICISKLQVHSSAMDWNQTCFWIWLHGCVSVAVFLLAKSLSLRRFFPPLACMAQGECSIHVWGVVRVWIWAGPAYWSTCWWESPLTKTYRQTDNLVTDILLRLGEKNSGGEKSYSHNLIEAAETIMVIQAQISLNSQTDKFLIMATKGWDVPWWDEDLLCNASKYRS